MTSSSYADPAKAETALEATAPYRLYHEGDGLYADMLASIYAAKRQILLETYIFADDPVGRRFLSALKDAAGRGVHVRLHVDALGCLFEARKGLFRDLRIQGVEVRLFHPWSWRDPWRFNLRNHCKLLIIDDSCAYLGGFNIHAESSYRAVGEERWRDSHLRLDNPSLVAEAREIFDALWHHRPRPIARRHREYAGLRLVSNRTHAERSQFRAVFREALAGAENRVRVTTPYFAPDPLTLQLMRRAAARGVRVELLLPSISDVWITQLAARQLYRRLLDDGLTIYEYQGRVMHAKCLTVDGAWSTIGTANLDYRSFFLNLELNLVSRRSDLCQALDQQFDRDRRQSQVISHESLSATGQLEAILGSLAWRLRRWL
ncbi:phosphatidylserine/phosphatidylglycerophosphate/cardiolipin synthase family protein [Gammaproteobacteria bacterium AB-CW1]|uniref:Phosphatidylserine/phosphatidylglycerophosphate/ cardiolipin synthase family protein n=1 Tax=Natronospira elongata TaxID=3110268 RepID=A0AAP6MMG9_9GAMM|nr:phosphatidylserine/phosphatidylglycerophosphate/cardiolipin synthase family protein [Gammaproteobacteria bacterium AB-CW1]